MRISKILYAYECFFFFHIFAVYFCFVLCRVVLGKIFLQYQNKQIKKKCDTFSICACHPCAGAMLIFSVSFQFLRMITMTTHMNHLNSNFVGGVDKHLGLKKKNHKNCCKLISSQSLCQSNIFSHYRHSFCMNCRQIRILKQ